jgi:hypothetical protein
MAQINALAEYGYLMWLLGRHDRDLDQHARVNQLGFDAGAGRRILAAKPGRPGFVHGIAVANIVQPHGCLNDLGFVSAADFQKPVDLSEHFCGLTFAITAQIAWG